MTWNESYAIIKEYRNYPEAEVSEGCHTCHITDVHVRNVEVNSQP
jgi:hypothetical protein